MQVTYTPHFNLSYNKDVQRKYHKVKEVIETEKEPERYYDWMLWKLKQKDSEDVGNIYD